MNKQPKILRQRKQSLNKPSQTNYNIMSNSIIKQATGGKIRSSSSLPKPYGETSIGVPATEASLFRENAHIGTLTQQRLHPHQVKQNQSSSYLLGWGNLLTCKKQSKQTSQNLNNKEATTTEPIKLAKNIIRYSLGQKHIVYVNEKCEAYGIGSSVFGQLGYYQSVQNSARSEEAAYNEIPIPILQEYIIKDVFCTPYCSFFITNREQVYGCGLNNRGQLGISPFPTSYTNSENIQSHNSIPNPTKIRSLSKKSLILHQNINNSLSRSSKKSKAAYTMNERSGHHVGITLIQQCKIHTEKSEGACSDIYAINLNTDQKQFKEIGNLEGEEQSILDESEFIINITGGPYHTIALSNKFRVFYSGNVYKKSSILNDEFALQFSELNLKKIGKVQKIKSGLTCIGLLNTQGSLFLLGAINENIICDEPYNVGINNIIDFGISKDKIFLTTSNGQVSVLVAHKKCLKYFRVNLGQNITKIVQIQSGLDYCFFVNEKGEVFGQGTKQFNLTYDEISSKNSSKYNENASYTPQKIVSSSSEVYDQKIYKVNFNNLRIFGFKTGMNFILGSCNKIVQSQLKNALSSKQNAKNETNRAKNQENNEELLKKIQQLEKQNRMLKDLIKDQGIQAKTSRNISSARKKDLTSSTNLGQGQTNKKITNQSNSKFDMNLNISEKIITKARKFESSMQIPFEELELGKQISEGGYGIIYKAVWRKTTVAVKIFKIDTSSQNSIKDFVSQCHAMEALRHPNIVMFLGACTKPPNFAIVLEYCEGGTLWSILQRNGDLSWEQRRRFALDTARGMNYLHERPTPILHRDLKSLNLLLDQNKRVKLADFGWTKGLQNYMTGKIGTYQWMAPQVVSSHQYTQKADVFSFGIILWQIASREAPYRNIPGAQVAQDVLNKDLRPNIPKKTPESFAALMKKCWGKNPESRPSFVQIIQELERMQLPN